MPELRDACYASSNATPGFIEFHFDEHRRKAFNAGHLITYDLEPNTEADNSKDDPPERLHLAFSTADVFILGWRLSTLADNLCANKLVAVAMAPKRYADMERKGPYVTSIIIKPIGFEKEGPQ